MSDYDHEFPLIDNYLSKEECHGIADKLGLKRPVMYDLGYPNNNCIGCVKGGMGYCIGLDSHFPIIRLKPRGSIKQCPLLKNRKCSVHKAKPAMCAMFPIGRVIAFPENGTSSDAPVIEYFYMNPGCGNNTRTQIIREWFDSFGIPLDDSFFIEWTTFQKNFVTLIGEAERFLDEAAMWQVWSPIFGILYLCYDLEKEFLPQFRENSENLLRGLRKINKNQI